MNITTMATKKVFNRMYEPWGYRDQYRYLKREGGEVYENDYFIYAEYDDKDEKIHFYNDMDKEVCSIDAKDFPEAKITATSYDASTKILTVKFDNGDTATVDLSTMVNGIERYVAEQIEIISGAVGTEQARAISAETILREMIGVMIDDSFTNIEYEWDEQNLKMSLKLYNVREELRDSVDLFDTDERGDIILDAGDF